MVPEQGPGTRGGFGWSDSKDLLKSVSTKTWVKRLESPITFLLYFIAYLKFRDFQFRTSDRAREGAGRGSVGAVSGA